MAEDRPERVTYPFPLPSELLDEEEDRDEGQGLSPFAIVNHLLRNARWVVGVPLLAFVVVTAYMATRESQFVAESRFLPARADFASAAATGMMSQLNRLVGVGAPGTEGVFYSFLIQSSAFLRPAAATEFEFERPTETGEIETVRGTLAHIFDHAPVDERADVGISLSLLRPMVSSRVDHGTGFVVVRVEAPWPGLAVAVSDRLLELVNEFNVGQRQAQAASERTFVEGRMAEAERELAEAEARLVRFLEQNQRYQQSPRLTYEAMRLESDVELKRALYAALAQSYEQARIQEVRNTPVVSVVERPEETVYRPRRTNSPIRYGMMVFIVAALFMIGLVALRGYLSRQSQEHPDDFDEFRRLARATMPPLPARLRDRLGAGRGGGRDGGGRGDDGRGDGGRDGGKGGGRPMPAESGAAASAASSPAGESGERW